MNIQPLPEDFLAAIGSIVTQFNNIDSLVSLAIIALTGNDFMSIKAHAPFAKLQFGPKKAILDLLVNNLENIPKGSPLESYWNTLRLPLDAAYNDRNAVAHSFWDKAEGQVFRRRMRVNKKVTIERIEVNKIDLTQIIVRMEECRRGMAELVFYLRSLRNSPQYGQNLKSSLASLLENVSEE